MRQCKVHVVRHEIEAAQPRDRDDPMHELGGRAVILPGGWLVEDERARPQSERDGQGESLLLPERQRQWGARQDVLEVVERRSPQAVAHEFVERGGIASHVPRAEQELVLDRASEQHLARALEDVAEFTGELRRAATGMRGAIDHDRPARDVEQPHGRPKERGLARAVRAEDRDDLVAPEPGVDAVEDRGLTDGRGDVAEFETRGGLGGGLRRVGAWVRRVGGGRWRGGGGRRRPI